MLAKEASLAHYANLLIGKLTEMRVVLERDAKARPQIDKGDTEAEDLDQAAVDCRKHIHQKINSALHIFEGVVERREGKELCTLLRAWWSAGKVRGKGEGGRRGEEEGRWGEGGGRRGRGWGCVSAPCLGH